MIVQRPRDHGLKFKPFDLGVSARWLQQQRRKSLARIGKSPREAALIERIKRLKKEAGTHSPSAWTLAQRIPELRLKVDACFLVQSVRDQAVHDALPARSHPAQEASRPCWSFIRRRTG